NLILCVIWINGDIPMLVIFICCIVTYFYYKLTAVCLHYAKHWSALLSFIIFALAIVFKQVLGKRNENDQITNNYTLFHGFWHIFSAFGGALMVKDAQYPPNYYVY